MKKIIIKATCISALLLSTQGWCGNTSVDLRFGHNTRSDVNDSRIKVMHQANNGFYFSVEAAQNHNDTFFGDTDRYNPDDKGLTEAAQEIETRWRFDLGNGFAVAPGMVTVFTASNTHYRPFIQGWKAFDNGLNLSARYRYNTVNDAHSDKELDGSHTSSTFGSRITSANSVCPITRAFAGRITSIREPGMTPTGSIPSRSTTSSAMAGRHTSNWFHWIKRTSIMTATMKMIMPYVWE